MSKQSFDNELSEICTELWRNDLNRLTPGQHYRVNLQGSIRRGPSVDRADDHLFEWVDEKAVFGKETFKTFVKLLDNYETESGVQEHVTEQEQRENWDFLNAAMKTKVMKSAHQFLIHKSLAPRSESEFKEMLYDIWFRLYRRTKGDRDFDSSAFEHVFVGETRNSECIGLHNWIQFYLQEKSGNIDYQGFYRYGTQEELGGNCRLITLQFKWMKHDGGKPKGSSFLGTSPEFELALYTVVHLLNKNCPLLVDMAGQRVKIFAHRMGRWLGSAYCSNLD